MNRSPLQLRLEQASQLLARLERVSADSVWAHRASGYRGSLLKWIDRAENKLTDSPHDSQTLQDNFEILYSLGLDYLARAARERLAKREVLK